MPASTAFPLRRSPRPTAAAGLAWLALAGACLLSGCGGGGGGTGASTPPPTTPVQVVVPGRWVVMGSSSAAGVGATAGQGWAARLAEAVRGRGVSVDNIARAGALTPEARPADAPAGGGRPAPDPSINLDQALARQPVLLLLSFPTNDTVAGYPAGETAANLRLLRTRAAAAGVPALVLGTQPRDGLGAEARATLAAIDAALQVDAGACFVPLQQTLGDGSGGIRPDYAAGDGIHLNDAGHAALQAQVQAVLDGSRCVRLAPP